MVLPPPLQDVFVPLVNVRALQFVPASAVTEVSRDEWVRRAHGTGPRLDRSHTSDDWSAQRVAHNAPNLKQVTRSGVSWPNRRRALPPCEDAVSAGAELNIDTMRQHAALRSVKSAGNA
jgi:hypothetical protein